MAALPNTLLEPLVHPSRQITATIYLFHKRWAVEVWTRWFVVHENATFCPKKERERQKKEMIQALWWKTLAGPDGASKLPPLPKQGHYTERAGASPTAGNGPDLRPHREKSGYAAMAAAADRTDVDHWENSQMRVWRSGGREGGRKRLSVARKVLVLVKSLDVGVAAL